MDYFKWVEAEMPVAGARSASRKAGSAMLIAKWDEIHRQGRVKVTCSWRTEAKGKRTESSTGAVCVVL